VGDHRELIGIEGESIPNQGRGVRCHTFNSASDPGNHPEGLALQRRVRPECRVNTVSEPDANAARCRRSQRKCRPVASRVRAVGPAAGRITRMLLPWGRAPSRLLLFEVSGLDTSGGLADRELA
jgi:hypothetical protein